MESSSYDAIVIGGGPAGTTAATVIAQQGHQVLLLDRDRLPRFHIGESLMPATYWTLKRLNMLDKMKSAGFVEKRSVQFVSASGKASAPFYFHEFDDHESSRTWQVIRSQFDKMLWDNAAEHGAEVREQANVKEILFDEGRATGVRVQYADGRFENIGARAIVDASGQSSLIVRQFGLREIDPVLRHAAYFTRYRGARREPGIDAGATQVLQTPTDNNWFWYIPQPDDVVSVGVVGPTDVLKALGNDPESVFAAEVANCPALQERIEGAEKLEDVQVLRDFSYISRRIAGDGWVLAGDAFGFLDPVYSTGAFLAMKSGEFAADAVCEGLSKDDLSAAQLGKFGDDYLAGMEAMRKLVYAYYDRSFAIPRFIKEHPHCREPIVNLLVGNVFRRPIGDLFELMGRYTDLPEERSLEPLEQLHLSRGVVALVLLLLLAVRHDLWLWSDARLFFGLPITLVYHLGYCFVAAATMAWLVSGGRLAALDAEADAER